MAYDHRHGAAFDAHDRALTAAMDRAAVRRRQETFDAIVRLLLALEQRDSLRINGHQIQEAAERAQKLSPAFAAVDVNECVRVLEHGFASRRAIQEVQRLLTGGPLKLVEEDPFLRTDRDPADYRIGLQGTKLR